MTFHPAHMHAGVVAALKSKKTPAHLKPHLEARMKKMSKTMSKDPAKKPVQKDWSQLSDMDSGFASGPNNLDSDGDVDVQKAAPKMAKKMPPKRKSVPHKKSSLPPAFFGRKK